MNEKTAPLGELKDAQINALLVEHGKGDDGFKGFARAIIEADRALHEQISLEAEEWSELYLLREAVKGPRGFATWQDAATDERIRRVKGEAAFADNEAAMQRAARTLISAGYTLADGAAEWKPPLGPSTLPLLNRIAALTAERDAAMASEAVYRKMCEEAKPFVEANSILRDERDALRNEIFNAKKLIADVYGMLPQKEQARETIERRTGNWFAFG